MTQWETLRADAQTIWEAAIAAVQPDAAVKSALAQAEFPGKIVLIAVGKAAWQMSRAAWEILGSRITRGMLITKYGHSKGPIGNLICYEAGHPVPDENGVHATAAALNMVRGLTEQDTVLLLLSGGGSALMEKPLIPLEELQDINNQLLACGAGIIQINAIRKRLSGVKGGRFAQACAPAHVFGIVLSDILGDPLDMIASGPVCPDSSTCSDARAVAEGCHLKLSPLAWSLLDRETPKALENVDCRITGSVRHLCAAAAECCRTLGYRPVLLTDQLSCQAREAGSFLGSIARTHAGQGKTAYLAGGETVVKLLGSGKGGRNQELALAAAPQLAGLPAALFSIGSDGTDGPTDAAGGFVDGRTAETMTQKGYAIEEVLNQNDAYTALKAVDGLIFTGPTGTNVNDVAVLLLP